METKTISKQLTYQIIDTIENYISKGLKESDFELMDNLIIQLGEAVRSNQLSKEDLFEISRCFGEEFLYNTLQGYALRKPQGYAGDYLIIDRIYTYHHSDVEKYKIWDKYAHTHASLKAVRNRKKYFKAKIKHKLIGSDNELDILNVASGPARDLRELYDEIDNVNRLNCTCVDLDTDAIAYAQKLNEKYKDKIEFKHANVLRFRNDKKFDVVWSAGLFDYFNDKAFIMLLSRFRNWVKPGGEIIIGNFNQRHNPSRDFMEIFGEWFLIHRTEEDLVSLAMNAGFNFSQINIGREPENVNLFLHIKC